MMSDFARRIREARAKTQLSQLQFAEAVGVSQGTVSKWETGQQQPDLPTIMKVAEIAKVNAMHLAFHDQEHSLSGGHGWSKHIYVKGAISNDLTEQPFWERRDWIDMNLPTPTEWQGLELFALLIKDESANVIFSRETIVVLAPLNSENEPRNGDVVFYSHYDSGIDVKLKINKLMIYNKSSNQAPVLSCISNMHAHPPFRLGFRNSLDVFAEGGYEGVGLLGMVVGSVSIYQPGRFPPKIVAPAGMPF